MVTIEIIREEWRLVRTRTSGCREERRVWTRGNEEYVLAAFAEHAPYGPRDVTWTIEHYHITEKFMDVRTMTAEEVAGVTSAEAGRVAQMSQEGRDDRDQG